MHPVMVNVSWPINNKREVDKGLGDRSTLQIPLEATLGSIYFIITQNKQADK